MARIYKYHLPITGRMLDRRTISMPKHAAILHIEPQGSSDFVAIWAEIDPAAEVVDRSFWIAATGVDLPEVVGKHLVTLQMGHLVWHIFEDTQ